MVLVCTDAFNASRGQPLLSSFPFDVLEGISARFNLNIVSKYQTMPVVYVKISNEEAGPLTKYLESRFEGSVSLVDPPEVEMQLD